MTLRKLLGLLLLPITTTALADWSPQFANGYFEATASYNGHSVSRTEAMTSNGYSNGPLSAAVRPLYALHYNLKTALDDELRAIAASASGYSASFVTSSLGGSIQMSLAGLTGAHTGLNQVSVGGLSYSALVRASMSWNGISYSCEVGFAINNVAAVITYQPYSGVISQDPALTYISVSPVVNAGCSNNIWLFDPLLSFILDRVGERLIVGTLNNAINGFSAEALRRVVPMGPAFLGISGLIAPGQYVVSIGGTTLDIGAYVRDNFASLFTGRTLTATLGPENRVMSVPGAGGTPSTGPYLSDPLRITFTDGNTLLTFSIRDVRYFNWNYVCRPRPGAHSCIEP